MLLITVIITPSPPELVSGSPLVLPAPRRGDAGAYLCIANNGVPPTVSKRVHLTVTCQEGWGAGLERALAAGEGPSRGRVHLIVTCL